jgi:hypothetical protein
MSGAVGAILALMIGSMARSVGLDRDRALYPVVLMVVASYYALFAILGGARQVLIIESAVAAVFLGLAISGFRSTLWIVAVALAGHGILDVVHPAIYTNPGVPGWWPSFCAAFDVVAAAYLGWLLSSQRVLARAARRDS